MKGEKRKHMPYYKVLEAMQKAEGCGLCDLEMGDMRRYFDVLAYEFVNDTGVRAELTKARGYCHRHAQMLLEQKERLGTAILYHEQVGLFVKYLKRTGGPSRKKVLEGEGKAWVEHERCPACRVQEESRESRLGAFIAGLGEADMRKALEAGAGLCAAHLLWAMGRAPNAEVRGYLREVHVGKLGALMEELSEFMRKNDYRFSHEGFGKEGDSWLRAVKTMTGGKGVF